MPTAGGGVRLTSETPGGAVGEAPHWGWGRGDWTHFNP